MSFAASRYTAWCDCPGCDGAPTFGEPGCDYGSASTAAANQEQLAFVAKVKARLGWTPTVSSYGRTPYEQAAAMLAKHAAAGGGAAGDQELHDTYAADSSIDTLLKLHPRTADIWAIWIAKYGLNLSRHLRGKAVDFSIRGLSRSQVEQLKRAIDDVGGRALEETAPPHVHADISRTGAIVGEAVQAARENATTIVPLVLLGGGLVWAKRRGWLS